MEEQEILAELGDVMDRLAAVPSDGFAERFSLMERQSELRAMLADAQVEAGRDAGEVWADQAARKRPDSGSKFIEKHLPDSSGEMGGW